MFGGPFWRLFSGDAPKTAVAFAFPLKPPKEKGPRRKRTLPILSTTLQSHPRRLSRAAAPSSKCWLPQPRGMAFPWERRTITATCPCCVTVVRFLSSVFLVFTMVNGLVSQCLWMVMVQGGCRSQLLASVPCKDGAIWAQ